MYNSMLFRIDRFPRRDLIKIVNEDLKFTREED